MKSSLFAFAFVLTGLVLLAAIRPASSPDSDAPSDTERMAVNDAVLDYLEGIYQADPSRIERSVSKNLVKYGYWRGDADEPYQGSAMNYQQLYELAAEWNVDNRRNITAESPRGIEVLDVLDKTATAKLTAFWGIDYFQLEKIGEKWMIRHIIWQSHP